MNTADSFWAWFKANNPKYYYLNQITDPIEKEKLLDELLMHLHAYCNKLYFEIGGMPNEQQEIIISAEGNKDYFKEVESLVESAPQIDGWDIIAFKPPMGVHFVTEYENIKLDPAEIWFLPLENASVPASLGLRVYVPDYKPQKSDVYMEACYQMLDVILGERSLALDIQHVEVDKLPKQPDENGLIELTQLPEFLSWRKSNKGLN